jgi:hypothetical protein
MAPTDPDERISCLTSSRFPAVFGRVFTNSRVSFANKNVRSSKSYGRSGLVSPFSSIPAIQPLIVSDFDIRISDFPNHDYTT